MTPDPDIDRIDRDRKRRESLLLLAMLTISRKAVAQARKAIGVGADAVRAAIDAIRGVTRAPAHVHWQGLESRVQPILAETYAAGIVRVGIMAGVTVDAGSIVTPQSVADVGTELAAKTETAFARVVDAAAREARDTGANATKAAQLLGEAFDAAGLTAGRPDALEAGAERAVVGVYGSGMFDAGEHKDLLGRVVGFGYVSVLDAGTTPICRAYNGVQLPTRHPWFLTHFPQNHWKCRAVIKPLFKPFTATEFPPLVPPPAPGFGAAPMVRYGALVGR